MRPQSVDEYIAGAPEEMQGRLNELRKLIKSLAPASEEKISYGMPYYGYKGRLVYFAYTKNHIGLYALFPDEQELKNDLKGYSTSKGTIRFPLNEELPLGLIKKLIKSKMKRNQEMKS